MMAVTAHFITRPLEGRQADEACTSTQFEAYKAAHEGLLSILEIEECWEVVLGNYRDYERGLADVLISRLTEQTHLDMASDRVRMARLLGNLLSSIKSFQDFSCRVIREANGRSAMASFKEFLQMRRQASFSSLLLDALRNHSQHHSLAVTRLTYSHTVAGSEQARVLEYRFSPQINLHALRKLRDWQELIQKLDKDESQSRARNSIDLTPHVRRYLYDQSLILDVIRDEELHTKQIEWADVVRCARKDGDDPFGEGRNRIVLAVKRIDGVDADEVELSALLEESINDYRKRNGRLNNVMSELRS